MSLTTWTSSLEVNKASDHVARAGRVSALESLTA